VYTIKRVVNNFLRDSRTRETCCLREGIGRSIITVDEKRLRGARGGGGAILDFPRGLKLTALSVLRESI